MAHRELMQEAACSGCGAAIRWGNTPRGAWVPLDAEPVKRYVVRQAPLADECVGDGSVHLVDTYMPHHATCPNVDQFRRRRPERPTEKPAPAPVSIGGAEGWPAA